MCKIIKMKNGRVHNMGNKVGYIYIMTSKSFFDHDCVKIGYSDNVEARRKQLSKRTDLPFDYDIYATYGLPAGVKIVDKSLHKLIEKLNPSLRINESREFFEISSQKAYELLECLAEIHGRKDKLVLYKNNKPIDQKQSNINYSIEEDSYKINSSENIEVTFTIKKYNVHAKGIFNLINKSLKILKGSNRVIRQGESQLKSSSLKLKNKLESEGIIQNDVFQEDYIFNSPSSAANQISLIETNGKIVWKDKEGKTIKELSYK